MTNSRRTPEEWHALGQFVTQMGFVACLVGAVFGVLYCFIFVTQPMIGQAKNDAVLFEILKTVLTSMISIIGTLMAVGHGSNASSVSSPMLALPAPTPPVTVTPTPRPMVTPVTPTPVTPAPRAPVRPLSTPPVDDDDPPFKGARE